MNKLRSIYVELGKGNLKVFGVILLSAALVLLVRLFSPLVGGWDANIQIEAAYRFADGLGLTNAFFSKFDLNQPPTSRHLTHFPPGFSLLLSSFLSFNISVAVALKIIYGLSTLVGWLGWGVIGSRCLVGPIKIGTKSIPLHLAISAILPILTTPIWQGTDIILWAGVPVVCLLLLCRSTSKWWIASTVTSALVFMILVSFRYAASFLLIYVLLIALYVELPNIKSAFRRIFLFLSTCLLSALPFLLYRWQLSETKLSEISNFSQTHKSVSGYTSWDFFELGSLLWHRYMTGLSNLYALLGIWNRPTSRKLAEMPQLSHLLGLLCLCFLTVFLFHVLKHVKQKNNLYEKDIIVVNTCLIASHFIFGTLLLFVIFYSPLQIDRYYVPVRSCLILTLYRAVGFIDFNQLLKRISLSLILVFVFFHIVVKPAYHIATDGSNALFPLLLKSDVYSSKNSKWSVNSLLNIRSETAEFLAGTKQNDVNSVFFIQEYPYYITYENLHRSLEFRLIPDRSFWQQAYLDRPTRVYWVTNYERCPLICPSLGNFNQSDSRSPIPELMSLPNLETVFVSSSEQTKVMMSDLPTGFRFLQGE